MVEGWDGDGLRLPRWKQIGLLRKKQTLGDSPIAVTEDLRKMNMSRLAGNVVSRVALLGYIILVGYKLQYKVLSDELLSENLRVRVQVQCLTVLGPRLLVM